MNNTIDWMRLVGMPYRMCADPRKGRATDCIHLAFYILELADEHPPKMDRDWYRMLAQKDAEGLRQEWISISSPTYGPEQYATTLLPEGDFAIAIVVDGGILCVRPEIGVHWTPLSNVHPMNYRRFHRYV
jgi:hypothetical protein